MRRRVQAHAVLGGALLLGVLLAGGRSAEAQQTVNRVGTVLSIVDDNTVRIDLGRDHGAAVGDAVQIYRPAAQVRIPLTDTVTYTESKVVAKGEVVELAARNARVMLSWRAEDEPIQPGFDARLAGRRRAAPEPAATLLKLEASALQAPAGRSIRLQAVIPGREGRLTRPAPGIHQTRALYHWSADGGTLRHDVTVTAHNEWFAPLVAGNYQVGCRRVPVGDGEALETQIELGGTGRDGASAPSDLERERRNATLAFSSSELQFGNIATTADGALLLTDAPNRRLLRLSFGGKLGELEAETPVARLRNPVAAAGFGSYVFVLDQGRRRVKVFRESDGRYTGEFGGAGMPQYASDLAISGDGRFVVLDSWNHEVVVFDRRGHFSRKFSRGEMPRQPDPAPEPEVDEEGTQAEEETAAPPQTDPEAPEEAAVDEEPGDADPLLVIEDVDEPEAAEEAPDVEPVPEEPASPPVPAGLLRDPVAVDASADGVVWILDASRRALIGMRREPGDAGAVPLVGLPDGQPVDFAFAPGGQSFYVLTHAPAAVWRLDTSGRRNGKTLPVPFRGVSEHSQRLAVDALGQVFVVGRYQGHVLRYSADGAFRGSYGGARVKETLDLATGADGRTWVLDAEAPFLLCFDRDGWLLGRRLAPGPRQSDISMPVRIAAGLSWREPDRETPLRLFGLEFRGVRVYAMNADGVLRRPKFFGGAERTGGPFRKPVDMAVADRCRFGVLDQALNKITLYWAAEPEGFRQWDRHLPDAAEGERIKPQLLTFDPLNGDAYVYDAVARTIARYDAITTRDTVVNKTGHIGGRGEAPGRFMDVVGMAVDAAGVLWVLDAERRDLQWFDARQEGLSHMGAYPLTEIRGDLTGVAVTPTGRVLVLSGEGELYAYRPVLP